MTGIFRTRAGLLLTAFMLIDLAMWAYTETAGSRLNAGTNLTGQQFAWTALDVFLVWRVWRGGRAAWSFLLGVNVLILVMMVLAGGGNVYAIVLYLFVLA